MFNQFLLERDEFTPQGPPWGLKKKYLSTIKDKCINHSSHNQWHPADTVFLLWEFVLGFALTGTLRCVVRQSPGVVLSFGAHTCPCGITAMHSRGESCCLICFLVMGMGLPPTSPSLQASLHSALFWNPGLRMSQQPEKRDLTIQDHGPFSAMIDSKEGPDPH